MPKLGIFNASLLLNEHGHPPFLFQNWSYHMTNIQWTKFEQRRETRREIIGNHFLRLFQLKVY